MNKEKANDIIISVIVFLKQILLTIFSGLFALTALGALFSSITEGGIIGVIGCVGCAFASAICWSIRRD